MDSLLVEICVALLCLATVGMHVVRKNRNEAVLYGLQSLAVVMLLAVSLVEHFSKALLVMAVVTLLVKVILAPRFFMNLVKRHDVKFASQTYANTPETILALVVLVILAGSGMFAPLANIVPGNHTFLVASLAAMLASAALMINRRGALSQIVGVLSLENCIVVFAIMAGLEQSAVLQAGVIFDVSVWLVIAVTMVSLVYKHHGSLDVSTMKNLRD
jgi:hydrogenase-4 component E